MSTRRRAPLILLPCLALLAVVTPIAANARQDAPVKADPAWLDSSVARADRAALGALVGKPLPAPPADARVLGAELPTELRGKVVVLQTWSRMNRASDRLLTDLAALAREHAESVVVIAAHPRAGADGVDAFLAKRDAPFTALVDDSGAFFNALGVGERPVNLVADTTGVVRYVGLSGHGVRAAIDALAAAPTLDAPAATPDRPKPAAKYPPIDGAISGARDLRGKKAPALEVQQWLTAPAQTSGKVVIVDFWATWCGPCVRMIPHMNDLAAAFPNDLAIVGLSNEDAETVRRFMRNTEMKYPVGVDPNGRMMQAVQVRAIPHVMVISPDGVVRWQGHPGRLTEQVMRQIIDASKTAT